MLTLFVIDRLLLLSFSSSIKLAKTAEVFVYCFKPPKYRILDDAVKKETKPGCFHFFFVINDITFILNLVYFDLKWKDRQQIGAKKA